MISKSIAITYPKALTTLQKNEKNYSQIKFYNRRNQKKIKNKTKKKKKKEKEKDT